eukprot:scaffold12305_cov117-Skeletonema_marinoi.AAC.1
MSNTEDDCQMIKTHNYNRSVDLSRADEVILDRITSKEYEMLGQYLNDRPSGPREDAAKRSPGNR